MYDHYKEASLPDHYRQREIACLASTLAMQRSARVAGLSGMGKSNLLRFLVSHAHILEKPPYFLAASVCFLHIDCNKLNPVNSLSFYRECNFLLGDGRDVLATTDEYALYKQLELALRGLERQTLVILVVDRVEHLYEATGPAFFGQLRNLRDEARAGRMLFIFGSHRPVGDLYELEKMFAHTCWVGPLSMADQAEFFERHQRRLGFSLDERRRQMLWRLTGGHPGLLKNGLEWLLRNDRENLAADEVGLCQALLGYEPIQKYCRRLWLDLRPEEQILLKQLDIIEEQAGPELRRLEESGLLTNRAGRRRLFSPLWQTYLRQHIWPQERVEPMQVKIEPARRQVTLHWQGMTAQTVITRYLVFELLRVLSTSPGQLFSKDELLNALYQEEQAADVLEDALFQLVTALRKALDPLVRQLCPAMTDSCIQNARGLGYRLVVDLPQPE